MNFRQEEEVERLTWLYSTLDDQFQSVLLERLAQENPEVGREVKRRLYHWRIHVLRERRIRIWDTLGGVMRGLGVILLFAFGIMLVPLIIALLLM